MSAEWIEDWPRELAEFDRWLNRIQAEAWDEGTRAVTIQRDGHGGIIPAPSSPNPYRTEED